MQYFLTYDNGYVVSIQKQGADGYVRHYPLRKFEEQGDAMIFRNVDCEKLTDVQVRSLIKNYKPNVKYKRLSARRFMPYENYAAQYR